jgi:hypothetical protein
MTTDRQFRANRANAIRSTGPKTAAGKTASRANARRHGIAASLRSEPAADKDIERLAHSIAGESATTELLELARKIAEAEILLRRVFEARTRLRDVWREALSRKLIAQRNSKLFLAAVRRAFRRKHFSWEHLYGLLKAAGYDPTVPDLIDEPSDRKTKGENSLDRYERRAISRRKSAIRAFDELRIGSRQIDPGTPRKV